MWVVWFQLRVNGVFSAESEIQWRWKVWVGCFQLRYSEGERCEWCAFSWDTGRVKCVSGVLSAETQWRWKVLVVCFQLRHSEDERCEWCAFSWDTGRVKDVSGVLSAETQWRWKVWVMCFQLRHRESEVCEWRAFSWDTVKMKGVGGVLSAGVLWSAGWVQGQDRNTKPGTVTTRFLAALPSYSLVPECTTTKWAFHVT